MKRKKSGARLAHPEDVALGARIKEVRKSVGVTRDVVSREIGVSRQQLQKYESGENRLAWSRLVEICGTLDVSVLTLITPIVKKPKR